MPRRLTPRALGVLLATSLSVGLVLAGVGAGVGVGAVADARPAATAVSALPQPRHLVIVMMENEDNSSIIGNTAAAPYLNSLVRHGASFSDAHGERHPSLPNYYALLSGSTQGLTDSTPPPVGSIASDNLPAELARHGLSFADYSDEATPAAWLRFADLPGTATAPNPVDRWLHCPSPHPRRACGFPADPAGYAHLPTVTFVHGNPQESMHDGDILAGDTWLEHTVGGYAKWARTHNSDLIVTWDEDDFTPANHLPTVFYGAHVLPGSYPETIDHYSMLRTVEDMYGLPAINASATAAPITDAWTATAFTR
ncbi:alkaline phosphatase family protein [Kitasatospora sp. NPDC006697]|uniref:alkaline phosphatase family protein n=1 Tax=Kitasatospora sp. NPDC006697 TaxID=3364020 RepID=UPI003696C237